MTTARPAQLRTTSTGRFSRRLTSGFPINLAGRRSRQRRSFRPPLDGQPDRTPSTPRSPAGCRLSERPPTLQLPAASRSPIRFT
jgi:hypothetical protein